MSLEINFKNQAVFSQILWELLCDFCVCFGFLFSSFYWDANVSKK